MLKFTKRVGCVGEILDGESRVALRPENVLDLLRWTNSISVGESAGKRSGFPNDEYSRSGAYVTGNESVWEYSDLIVKVKQPLEEEFEYLRKGSALFCFLHLADNLPLLDVLLKKRITAIGYETIQLEDGSTPILAAMSKIAGRVAFFDGAKLLMRHRGITIGPESTVTIIGLGNAGTAAAEHVVGANPKMLYLLDKNPEKFEPLRRFYQRCSPYDLWFVEHDHKNEAHKRQLASILERTDLSIFATHIPGEKQVKLAPKWMIGNMPRGAIAMDIPVDQGGALESSEYYKKTGRQIFKKNGVWHYCVPNIPGRVPVESTPALCKETFPYIAELVEKGFERAVRENPALAKGVNTHKGWITHEGLARSIGRIEDYKPLEEVL